MLWTGLIMAALLVAQDPTARAQETAATVPLAVT